MNYETFKSSAAASIQKYFGDNVSVSLHSIQKNNDVLLDGLMIQDPSVNIAPAICLNCYYEDYLAGKPLSSVYDDIIKAYRKHLPQCSVDLSFFMDYNKVKYQIIYKLIHYEKNLALLKDVPHFRFLDLAVVFCCYLPDTEDGNATILIHNSHLNIWNITPDVLYDLAMKNTPILLPYELKRMEDALKSLCPGFVCMPCGTIDHLSAMYVLTNTEKLFGASAILYPEVLSYFSESIGQDLYVIPSSIHEVLLFPRNFAIHAQELNDIINEVNASQVPEEEILSDHVYLFNRASGIISL